MAESLIVNHLLSREEQYKELLPQIEALISSESDTIANLANITAALHQVFGFLWIGFYIAKNGELVLGPFQGPIACTRIPFNKGVCGAAYSSKKTIVVPNVDEFPGHIACSSSSRSEIVVPIIKGDTVIMVLDVDSNRLDDFSQEIDKVYLEKLANIISGRCNKFS
jgi:L-methionine (R)-S-oxide reductase